MQVLKVRRVILTSKQIHKTATRYSGWVYFMKASDQYNHKLIVVGQECLYNVKVFI